ncbi:MAG: signal peptidase II [Gemmatimonadetes bacterium]|nr:MAG: signal peptidase II [Gemmatimonadota bacterium]
MRSHTPVSASSARPKRKMVNAAERRLFWGTATAVVVSDFVTKLIAESFLARRLPLRVIGDVVQFRLVYNEGAAFGLHVGDNSRWIFMALAVIALFVLASLVRGTRPGDRFRLIALALVCGGAVGNLIDRIRSAQGVVDFVDVGIGAWRWPTFNVADSAITIGAIALGLSLWQEGRAQQRAKEARAAEP